MDELALKKLWQASNEKLEMNLAINKINSMEISKLKVHHFISSMKPVKIFTLLVGIGWVGFGATVLARIYSSAFTEANKFFLFSATIQVGLTAIALLFYLYQLILIYQVDISEAILQTQEKLARLKSSTLWVARILFLQLPVWTTFWWNNSMFQEWNLFQWAFVILVTLSFTFVALWLFFNIKYENRNKQWFQFIFVGKEWKPLMQSMDLLQQIGDFKDEN